MELIKKTITEELSVAGADFKGSTIITDGVLSECKITLQCNGSIHHIQVCSEEQLRDLTKELSSVINHLDSIRQKNAVKPNINVQTVNHEEHE